MHGGSTTEYSPAQEAWPHSISTPWVSTSTAEERKDFSLKPLQRV